jgi:hypothetical protein
MAAYYMISDTAAECEVMKVRNAVHNPFVNGYYVLMDHTCEDQLAWKRVVHQLHEVTPQSPVPFQSDFYYLGYSNRGGVHGWAVSKLNI